MTVESPSVAYRPDDHEPLNPVGLVARLVDRALPTPTVGCLRLTLPNGAVIRRGATSGPEAEMRLHHWRGLWRVVVDGDHGFAEGYLDGDWSTTDLRALLEFFMLNEAAFAGQAARGPIADLRNKLRHRRRANTRRGSRRNIAAHYDLGNDFYRRWLDRGMNYSSALYSGDETLEVAQEAKLDRIAALLDIEGRETVLEIGCGWGALAERLVRDRDCAVTGITLSREQLAYASQRLASGASIGRAEIRLQDYRDIQGTYDRVVSIEMLEAVGERYWPVYFDKLRAVLAPGGTAVLQVITIDEGRFDAYRDNPDFIQRHIFPGGMLPTASRIEDAATQAGMAMVHREAFGASYARTLQAWRTRFARAWDEIEPLGFDERFRRMWDYYLVYCEIGFLHRVVDVSLFKLRG